MEVDTQSDKFGLRTDSGKSQVLLYVKIKYSPALDLSSPQSSAEFPMRMPAFLPSIAARYPHELAVAEDEKAQQPFVSQPVKNAGCDVLIQME
ncbi:MAG: hypothetical protein JWM78_987 [Verrucomicrobiaceae bacterium]|nr:hypothetical protein [Verrucomicrobiaceae bacterium]